MKNKENTLGANKQMAFLNSTKLAVLSAMLLLAVFCTIGMSFTPAEEGENIGNPNDSTYITGPRRSHWTTTESNGCGSTTIYRHAKDYARVEARIRVHDDNGKDITNDILQNTAATGKIKISFNNKSENAKGHVEEGGIIDNNEDNYEEDKQTTSLGTAVYLNWNCGIDDNLEGSTDKPNPDIDKSHKLEVTLTATHWPNSDYIFAGWYLESNNNAQGSEKDTILTQTITIGGGGDGYTTYHSGATDIPATYDTQNRDTVKYYALYKPAPPIEVSLIPSENGSYTYKIGKEDEIQVSEESTISVKGAFTLKATPDEKHKFFGWYELIYEDGEKKEKYFSYETTTTATFLGNTTISAKFIPKDWATYIVSSKPEVQYYDFQAAANAAEDPSTDKVFLPLVDGVVPAGNYTIPSGVTLLIPYESTNIVNTDTPDFVKDGNTPPSKFRELKLTAGVSIEVNGSICVNAKLRDRQNSNGAQNGKCGMINMEEGSTITLKKDAKLYCWGIIHGDGEITAEGGSFVYESFQVNDYPGGTWLSGNVLNGSLENHGVFPIRIYCFPNIQSKLHLECGATEKVATAFANLGLQKDVVFISSDAGLFVQKSGSVITKWYNKENDLQQFQVKGEVNLKSVTLKVATLATINSANFILPFTHNMHIELLKGSTANITENIAFLPSAKVVVNEGATVNINSGKMIHVYDTAQWKNNYTYAAIASNAATNKNNFSIVYNRAAAKKRSYLKNDLSDAVFEVNGTINIKGALYTTSSGADICSTGAGKVIFDGINAPDSSKAYQVEQGSSTNATYREITITAAQLHNDESKTWNQDDEYKYTPTAGAVAGDIFTYSETYGRWRCERTITWDANGGTIEPLPTIVGKGEPLSLYFPESLPTPTRVGYTFNGWFTEASGGDKITTTTVVDNDVTYYALWTLSQTCPLDIVDADNTNKTLTINTNGWASSRWSYTINDIPYEKNARQADRTLVIPYGDKAPNKEIVIEVKNESDEVISNHIYKVPFVYTGDATMSGTDENSIVFVKSGTLTVGTASAKEIYVAPRAELKVTGTLTVGKLVLRTTPWQSAVLTIENGGAIADGGQVYYSRISPDAKQYYQFGLPLSCPLANVKMSNTDKLGGSQPKYGTAWMLKSYSESSRAEKGIREDGANWTLLENTNEKPGTIIAGVGYEMFSNSNYYREFYFPVNLSEATTQVSVQYTGGTIGAEHNGWNIITSPLTSKATVTIGDPATAIKVCWLQADGTYKQELPTIIPPAIPFAYQASAGGNLKFTVSNIAAAPRKQSAAEALTETEWIHLDIFDAYGEGDETSLFVHPTRFEHTYKTGIDVAKQSLTAARPIIYSTHAYGDIAFAGIADSLLENGIDLVVYSPAAQELTFSLRENKFLHRLKYLWLADNETGERTDLLMDDYTCRANADTIKGRFVLNGRFKAPQISTGIGNTQTDYNIYAIGNNIAISGVEQGTPIYVFDAVGHTIYTTSATSDEVIVPAPCAGVYMLTIGGQTAKLVVNQ